MRRYLTSPEGFQGRVLNKYGLRTEASGTIKVGSRCMHAWEAHSCRCCCRRHKMHTRLLQLELEAPVTWLAIARRCCVAARPWW